jgi:hypothetical protein
MALHYELNDTIKMKLGGEKSDDAAATEWVRSLPVGTLLESAYTCHSAIKGEIEAREQNNSAWSTVAEPDPGGLALGHICWVDNVLTCMMVEGAFELRQRSPQAPTLPIVRVRGLAPLHDQQA